MELLYYPGCTLYVRAAEFNSSIKKLLTELGIGICELEKWTCCGAVFPLAEENCMGLVAGARILIAAEKLSKDIVTACSFCYNTLRRVNVALLNEEKREKVTSFLEEEYKGKTKVYHIVEAVLKFADRERIKRYSLRKEKNTEKVACYYGCMLERPKDAAIDERKWPTMMEEMLNLLGIATIDFPLKTSCCGSYQVVNSEELALEKSREVLQSASSCGATTLVTTCPLCWHNLRKVWEEGLAEVKYLTCYIEELRQEK